MLGMDAYHLPNMTLRSRRAPAEVAAEEVLLLPDWSCNCCAQIACCNLCQITLYDYKGRDFTFDAEKLLEDLQQILNWESSDGYCLPVYDRKLHDPIEKSFVLQKSARIVIVEGLFLCQPSAPWNLISQLFHNTIHLNSPQRVCISRLKERNAAAGRTSEFIGHHIERVDAENIQQLQHACLPERASLSLQFGENDWLLHSSSRLNIKTNNLKSQEILCIGLNPALQKTLQFKQFCPRKVNRAVQMHLSVGGKALVCSMAANCWQLNAAMCATFLSKEYPGPFIMETLHNLGIRTMVELTHGMTRTCTTIVCQSSQNATELIEPAPTVTPEQVGSLFSRIQAHLDSRCVDAVTLNGTYPPGVSSQFFINLANHVSESMLLVLDAYKGVQNILETNRVDLLKINRKELLALTGFKCVDSAVKYVFDRWLTRPGASLGITDGAKQAHLYTSTMVSHYRLPTISVQNPIGAGDTCTAVTTCCLLEKVPVSDAFRWGLAAASASCMTSLPASYQLLKLLDIFREISVTTEVRAL